MTAVKKGRMLSVIMRGTSTSPTAMAAVLLLGAICHFTLPIPAMYTIPEAGHHVALVAGAIFLAACVSRGSAHNSEI